MKMFLLGCLSLYILLTILFLIFDKLEIDIEWLFLFYIAPFIIIYGKIKELPLIRKSQLTVDEIKQNIKNKNHKYIKIKKVFIWFPKGRFLPRIRIAK